MAAAAVSQTAAKQARGLEPLRTRAYSHAAQHMKYSRHKPQQLQDNKPSVACSFEQSLSRTNISVHSGLQRNSSAARLYEDALRHESDTAISSTGALIARSGKKTGRSPRDKRIVEEASTVDDVWWGPVNKKLSEEAFEINYKRAVNYLNRRERLYVFDGFAGWNPKYRIKVRVICARAYHAL
ncbi:Protein kinase C-like 1, partial [Coemansia sp. RSA 1365]